MAGYGEFISPGWFQDDDTDITLDNDDLWLLKNLRDEHLDGDKILKEQQKQSHQKPTMPFATPMISEQIEEKRSSNIPKRTQQHTEYFL